MAIVIPLQSKQIQQNTFGIDSSDYNVDVTGGSNTFTLDTGTTALAGTLDLDWIINGDSNTLDFDINYDGATNYVDVDGDSNTINFSGSGKAGGYFYLDQTGNSRTFNITQSSTLASDWLKIISTGNNGTLCVVQTTRVQAQAVDVGNISELFGSARVVRDKPYNAELEFDIQQNDEAITTNAVWL